MMREDRKRKKRKERKPEEPDKTLAPHLHAFSDAGVKGEDKCWYCEKPLSAHKRRVDCSTGERRVVKVR